MIYIGGNFTYVGPNTGFGAPIDATSTTVLPSFPHVNGTVNAAISDGAGGWYIGGDFTRVGGFTRNRIAHILSDYTLDPNFNPNADNAVNALVLNGSTVYAGGVFTSIGGQNRNHLAALDTSSGTANPSWNPNANATVYALAINGSTLYAGGNFTTLANGATIRNRLAAICITANCDGSNTAAGTATTWNPNANATVSALAINGSTLYAGGSFTSIGGQTRNRLAAICITANCDGSGTAIGTATNTIYLIMFKIIGNRKSP